MFTYGNTIDILTSTESRRRKHLDVGYKELLNNHILNLNVYICSLAMFFFHYTDTDAKYSISNADITLFFHSIGDYAHT